VATWGDIGREVVAEAGPVIVGVGAGGTTGWVIAAKTAAASAHVPVWSGWSVGGLLLVAVGVALWGVGKAIRKPSGPTTIQNFYGGAHQHYGGGGSGPTGPTGPSAPADAQVAQPPSREQDDQDEGH